MADDSPTPAYLDGWHSHRLGGEVDNNPYDEKRQAYSHNQWLSGWCARFSAIKHGQRIDGLDHDCGEA